jgi:hypothetical protein
VMSKISIRGGGINIHSLGCSTSVY